MYTDTLPEGCSLCVYNGDELIFSSGGKWLMPLFELEEFLRTYTGARDNLCAHDTAVGKAAAFLMVRLGIRAVHAELASSLAAEYIDGVNKAAGKVCIVFSYTKLIPRLMCATEAELAPMTDEEQMYGALLARAKGGRRS